MSFGVCLWYDLFIVVELFGGFPMAVTGKTGADAIFKALKRVCIVLGHYQTKLAAATSAALASGAITSAQKTQIDNFVAVAVVTCDAFRALADYSGF